MVYLKSFTLASRDREDSFVLNYPHQLEMQCYTHDVYPFKLFPDKGLSGLEFDTVTVLYGSNGSGKSTLLNVIGEKLCLARRAPFNDTPYFEDYLALCSFELNRCQRAPEGSKLIASDDVFDFLLDIRSINRGVADRREELFSEYEDKSKNRYLLKSLDDYYMLKEHNEAKRLSKSKYTEKRLPKEISTSSNGESALAYFSREIRENALYLLDEPENSLSVKAQKELCSFISDSARFYNCQFIISTHSPLLLALKGAKVYDLDARPVCERAWTELENVREWFSFFEEHRDELV